METIAIFLIIVLAAQHVMASITVVVWYFTGKEILYTMLKWQTVFIAIMYCILGIYWVIWIPVNWIT